MPLFALTAGWTIWQNGGISASSSAGASFVVLLLDIHLPDIVRRSVDVVDGQHGGVHRVVLVVVLVHPISTNEVQIWCDPLEIAGDLGHILSVV